MSSQFDINCCVPVSDWPHNEGNTEIRTLRCTPAPGLDGLAQGGDQHREGPLLLLPDALAGQRQEETLLAGQLEIQRGRGRSGPAADAKIALLDKIVR